MSKPIDETGKRYGHLVVLERAENDKFGKTRWLCQCDCGNQKIINGSSLRRGLTVSCGCHAREEMQKYNESKVVDEVGHIYGYLTVISRNRDEQYKKKDNRAMWNCQCICGNTCVVSGKMLRNGSVTSCGCRVRSLGEEAIENLLLSKDISFVTEYPIKVKNRDKKLKIDFAILDSNNQLKYAIEFDGEQHFFYKKGSEICGTEADLQNIQNRDKDKNLWCKENNIPLIRIPYWHLSKLCLEDLLLETTTYLIQE